MQRTGTAQNMISEKRNLRNESNDVDTQLLVQNSSSDRLNTALAPRRTVYVANSSNRP